MSSGTCHSARKRKGRSMERGRTKKMLINGISVEGDTCRRWEQQACRPPLTFCLLSFLPQAVPCRLPPDYSRCWKCACILRILNQCSELHPIPPAQVPALSPLSLLATAFKSQMLPFAAGGAPTTVFGGSRDRRGGDGVGAGGRDGQWQTCLPSSCT